MAPAAAVQKNDDDGNEYAVPKPHLIFVYGTLKRGFPNHHLMEDLIRSNDAVPLLISSSSSPTSSPGNNYPTYRTVERHPLVRGPHGTPYLLNIPGSGRHVRGELYSVSASGLVRLDELERTSIGHYERLPMKVVIDKRDQDRSKKNHDEEECCGCGGDGDFNHESSCDQLTPAAAVNVIEAEAYYAHRSYAEDMWRRCGMVGLEEYTLADSDSYVKRENRPSGESFIDRIRAYVASSD